MLFKKLKTLYFLIKRIKYIYKEKKGKLKKIKIDNKHTFSHVTYYIIGNAGDIALSQCVRRMFEKNFKLINWNLIKISNTVDKRIIDKINHTKALIIGGGGLFLPDTNENVISGWQWGISGDLLNKIEVPIIVYSVGYNYFYGQECSELFRRNLAMLCDRAKFVGLRNTGSILAVKGLLNKEFEEKILYQPCITTLIRKLYGDAIPPKRPSRKVAFNFAFDREERRYGKRKEQILYAIASAAKMIEERGYEIYLVYHVSSDIKAKKYMDAMGVHYKEKDLVNTLPNKIFLFYNQIELVFGMRGHAQMIPFGLNCEIVSLVTHNKMKLFLEDINAIDWQIDLMEENENLEGTIYEKFIQIHENSQDDTRRRLIESQEKLWKISQENMAKISEILNANSMF